jgi:ankyrin repeat protein
MKVFKMFVFLLACAFFALQADEIHQLVKNNQLFKIKKLVKDQPHVTDSIDKNGRTALHWACRMNQLDIISFLIHNNSNINIADNNNIVPLHSVAANGNIEACKMLLNKKAQVDRMSSSGNTPLHYAVSYGHFDMVKLLIKNGASLDIKNKRQRTPLILAAREMAGVKIVRLLVEKGADVNARDYSNNTPLSLAAWRGSEKTVNYLLSKNAELDVTGIKGFRLLYYSINKKLWHLYHGLVKKCEHLKRLIPDGQTILHWASKSGFLKVIMEWVAKGANPNEQDVFGWTPLHYAARYGRIRTVKYLVNKGADVNVRLRTGESPLNLAKRGDHKAVVNVLLERGANPENYPVTELTKPYFGQSPPGEKPQLFAPGIVNNLAGGHSNVSFSPCGRLAAWTEWNETEKGYADGNTLWFSRMKGKYWLQPIALQKYGDTPFFSSDGKRLYFLRAIPGNENRPPSGEMQYYEIRGGSLSKEPEKVNLNLRQIGLYWQFTVDKDKNIYFGGMRGLCRAVFNNNDYSKIEKISDIFHPDYAGGSPFIAPDRSYIIFSSKDYPENRGQIDLYIGFKKTDGTWSKPINMGAPINSAANDHLPMVSTDGKFFFYTSNKDGQTKIYWISTKIIHKLKQDNM